MRGGVFVCHAAADAGTAQRVVAALEAANVPCWIAPRDIEPGEDWAEAIVAGIKAAPAMVLVFSSATNDSPHVPRELEAAVKRRLPIVPVRLEHAEPSPKLLYFIGQAHWLETSGIGAQQWESPLVHAVRRAVGGQHPPPTTKVPAIPQPGSRGPGRRRTLLLWGGAAAALGLVVVLLAVLLTRRGDEGQAAQGHVPQGRAGMASVFPSFADDCGQIEDPPVKAKTEVYLCHGEGYQVRYSRWEDSYDVVGYYDQSVFAGESGDWIVDGEKVGERWKYDANDPNLPYRWSAAYQDLPFSVDVEAESGSARQVGITEVKPAAPDDIDRE